MEGVEVAIVKRMDGKGRLRYGVVAFSASLNKQVWIGTFARKHDADVADAEAKRKLRMGEPLERITDMTFGNLVDEWLSKAEIRPSTRANYVSGAKRAIAFFRAGTPVSGITVREVEAYIASLRASGMATSTIRTQHQVLRACLEAGVRYDILKKNPARYVGNLPKKPRRGNVRVLTPAEHSALIEAAPDIIKTMIAIWPFVGLRIGEMAGLKWEDIDLPGRKMKVQRQSNRRGAECDLKSDSGYRTIYLTTGVCEALMAHKRHPLASDNEGHVFCSPLDHVWMQDNFRDNYWKKMLEAAPEVERLTPHAMRHTCASWLMTAGANIKYVQHQLGHSSPTMTLDTYSHLLPEDDPLSARKLEAWHNGWSR